MSPLTPTQTAAARRGMMERVGWTVVGPLTAPGPDRVSYYAADGPDSAGPEAALSVEEAWGYVPDPFEDANTLDAVVASMVFTEVRAYAQYLLRAISYDPLRGDLIDKIGNNWSIGDSMELSSVAGVQLLPLATRAECAARAMGFVREDENDG